MRIRICYWLCGIFSPHAAGESVFCGHQKLIPSIGGVKNISKAKVLEKVTPSRLMPGTNDSRVGRAAPDPLCPAPPLPPPPAPRLSPPESSAAPAGHRRPRRRPVPRGGDVRPPPPPALQGRQRPRGPAAPSHTRGRCPGRLVGAWVSQKRVGRGAQLSNKGHRSPRAWWGWGGERRAARGGQVPGGLRHIILFRRVIPNIAGETPSECFHACAAQLRTWPPEYYRGHVFIQYATYTTSSFRCAGFLFAHTSMRSGHMCNRQDSPAPKASCPDPHPPPPVGPRGPTGRPAPRSAPLEEERLEDDQDRKRRRSAPSVRATSQVHPFSGFVFLKLTPLRGKQRNQYFIFHP